MSQPANDEFSQHLSDDEASNHEDASDSARTILLKAKKTGRRVRVDGKAPVGFDKKKLECFNCHNTGHFARECTAKGTHDGKKKRDSFYQHQEARKQEKNQMGLLTMDDGIVNWGEHTEDEETNHALMAISSSSEVSLCSKTCIDSYNTLKTLCDEQMNQLGDQEAQILAYSQAVKKLEAQLVTFQKQQLSLNEKLTFQANEIYEKDEKLKKYRRIGMKAVKEKEQLQKTLDSWKDSSKNLWRLINSGMSSSSKIGLGYEIKSDNEVLSYEEEMNFSVFNCTEEDSVGKPLYSRFIKTNDFKGVPHPLSGDYTPTPQEEIDESLYVYGKRDPKSLNPVYQMIDQVNVSTCQSIDSAGILLEFLYCDFYEKKMAREAEFKKQKVFNTGNGGAKPVWTKANKVNHANQFVPRPVQLKTGRPNINSVRTNINTGRTNINSVREIRDLLLRPRQVIIGGTLNQTPIVIAGSSTEDMVIEVAKATYLQHKVPFTKTECLVVSSDFKMPDENQILLRVLDIHNMFCFDMKTPTPAIDKPNVKGVGYRWMFDIDYLTDSMNYIPVSLENQANPHAGASEVSNSAGTSQTQNSNASEEKDEDVELIFVPSAVKNTEEKVESNTSSTNSKKQEKKASSTDTSKDNPKILALRSTPSVNTSSESVNTGRFDPDDSPMPELEIFHKSETGIFDEASYDEEDVITDFNSLPTEIEVSPTHHFLGELTFFLGYRANRTRQNFFIFSGQRIFKYLKGKPHLGFWYPRESPFDMEAFFDSDYGGSNLDRKSITGGCQILGQRISHGFMRWFCCKPVESAGFAEIVDFLRGSNLRYALTTNPTIYDSLVKQFWQTTTANTLADGTLELHATIDTIMYTITEASIRNKLQLADASGITMCQTIDYFGGALKKAKRVLLSDSKEDRKRGIGRRKFHDLDPLVSLLQELVTPSKTPSKTVNALGEEQVEDISLTTLEAAAILTKVKKIKSVDKGKRYKRRKVSKESAGTGLDFEEVKSAFEEVNTGSIKVSTGIESIMPRQLEEMEKALMTGREEKLRVNCAWKDSLSEVYAKRNGGRVGGKSKKKTLCKGKS
ncbi:ribonuclease H-like domain-containing protein [Tanacetum coccineum]